jgi:hypothetical protein
MRYLSVLLLSACLVPAAGMAASATATTEAAAAQSAGVALETATPNPLYVAIQNSGRVETLPSGETWSGIEGAHYDALSSDGRWLLVSRLKTGKVYLIDTQTGEMSTSIEIGELAQGVKISPDDRYGVAVAAKQGAIVVINLSTQTVAKKIPVGNTPHNARFSADGKLAYMTLQGAVRSPWSICKRWGSAALLPRPGSIRRAILTSAMMAVTCGSVISSVMSACSICKARRWSRPSRSVTPMAVSM